MKLLSVRDGSWTDVRKNFQTISAVRATQEFPNLKITGLTASQLLQTDANKKLTSIALPLIVAKGGTGATTLTNHGILLGSGTSAVTALGAATDGQLPIGSTGADPVLAGITGTANQITVTNGAGSIALSFPTNLSLSGYTDWADIADPGAPAASKSRLFSNSGHTISIAPDDVWHDLSMGGLGTSSCVHDAITVTDADGLNITWSAGTIFDAAISGASQMVTIAAQPANQACAASNINYLFFDHSAGILVLNTSGPDYSDGDFSIAHILTTHNDIFEIFYRPVDKEVVHNIKWSLREAFPNVVVSGLVVSAHAGDGAFDVDQSAGSFVHGGFSLKTASLIDSTVTNIIRWYHNAADTWETDTNAQIDAANWDDVDDGATVKGTSSGKYYRSVFVTCGDCIHWVYPQVEYANIAAALAGVEPILPAALEHLPKTTVLIMKHGDGAFPAAGSDQWIDVRPMLGVVSTGASIADHGSLTGLSDDDHTQYIKDAEFTQDSGVLVGTGAGAFQEETGNTLRTSLGLAIGTDVQAHGAILDDLNTQGDAGAYGIVSNPGSGEYRIKNIRLDADKKIVITYDSEAIP